MRKSEENEKVKKELCPYGKNLSCVCAFCERRKGCFNCLDCQKNGKYELVNDCDMIIWGEGIGGESKGGWRTGSGWMKE